MTLRKLATIAPMVAALALSAPVASASADDPAPTATPGSQIPCYPFPAWCGPDGKPLAPWPFTFALPIALPIQSHLPLLPFPGLPR